MIKLFTLLLLVINLYAENKNVGFLMNQKYACLNKGALIDKKIVPILSEEDSLKHPMRILIDDNNVLQTDGILKNLKHIEKTVYGNSQDKIMLFVEKNQRYIFMMSKEMNNMPIAFQCVETNNWTITK